VTACSEQLLPANTSRVSKIGNRIRRDSSAEKLHKLRIRAKQLRYLLGFFSTVQVNQWQKALAAMQKLHDILGDHQDAITGQQRLADYVDTLSADASTRDLLLALGRLQQHEDERISSCRRRFPAAWSRFRKTL
jgi:CHAD domain-containing protein